MPRIATLASRDASDGLPARYSSPWRAPFEDALRARLAPGKTVLDIGSGRNPSLEPHARPPGIEWIGLDVSLDELMEASASSYSSRVVADVADFVPALEGRIDLAVSWQVLEHVRPLDHALANVQDYLREGGEFVSLFSGSRSAFALVNRALPDRAGAALVGRTMRRRGSAHPVFPAHYDRCHASALERLFSGWSDVRIEPIYRGATYFHFSRPLQRAYVAYENAIMRRGLADLATHYFVIARR